MTIRRLDGSDLSALAGTDLAAAWPVLPPGGTILLCEDAGRVLGHLALIPFLHVEGIGIRDDVQGLARGVVLAHLLDAMHAEARACGQRTVFPAAADARMVTLLERLAARAIPAQFYALDVKES